MCENVLSENRILPKSSNQLYSIMFQVCKKYRFSPVFFFKKPQMLRLLIALLGPDYKLLLLMFSL